MGVYGINGVVCLVVWYEGVGGGGEGVVMTKKHYKEIAKGLNRLFYNQGKDGIRILDILDILVPVLQEDNKKFDKDRFERAVLD